MAINITTAFPVTESTQVGAPRRAVIWLAEQMRFSEERAGRAALIVSELATNLVKHAHAGEILLRQTESPSGEPAGIEVVAVDGGPGIADPVTARVDGHSTAGTLGHGLGSLERLSDSLDLYTDTNGTAVVALIEQEKQERTSPTPCRFDIGAVNVSKPGEDFCGDGWGWRMRDERLAVMIADGLGHGVYAHEAAREALTIFARRYEDRPSRVIDDVHAGLRATRGAAVAMLAVNLERGTAAYAGLGNISSTILAGRVQHRLVSHNGTAGHTAARIQEFNYPVPAGSVIVMASDGLRSQWDLGRYSGLLVRKPSTIAAILYRDFSRRRDDVTVVVAKDRVQA